MSGTPHNNKVTYDGFNCNGGKPPRSQYQLEPCNQCMGMERPEIKSRLDI